jgi:hypothetical protein
MQEGATQSLTAVVARIDNTEAGLDRLSAEIKASETSEKLQADLTALKDMTCWIHSLVILQFPPLFEEFRAKCFNLLWRGSHDGFGATEFHRRCDGCANTLTLISDTDGNVFGGFTPVKWESNQKGGCMSDDSLKSFIFTLKNPSNFPPSRFALQAECKQYAIYCHSDYGPGFGIGKGDIYVANNCNASNNNYTNLGGAFVNDTGIDGKQVFTGEYSFTVKELEVFTINL